MATPWYAYPVTQSYGQNGETGIDFGTPFHTPITALFAGTVMSAGRTQWGDGGSSGGIVKVKANIPGLGVITTYYLHLDTAAVTIGDSIHAGQLLGLSGGQLSGGQWPVVNTRSATYSTGPHTEFGFEPNRNPAPYIQQARAGTLPATTPDGTATGVPVSTAPGGSASGSGVQTPTLIETALINYNQIAAVTRRHLIQPVGFDGICEALDAAEVLPDFNWLNPFGSMWAMLRPLSVRGLFVFVGLMLVVLVMVQAFSGQLSQTYQLIGNLTGGGGQAATGATALAEAPEAVAL